MILHVPNVLTGEQVARCRDTIMRSKWVDGRVTASYRSALVKNNLQLPEDSPEARELGDMILAALERHPLFIRRRCRAASSHRSLTATMSACRWAHMWTTPFGPSWERRFASAPISRPRSS